MPRNMPNLDLVDWPIQLVLEEYNCNDPNRQINYLVIDYMVCLPALSLAEQNLGI